MKQFELVKYRYGIRPQYTAFCLTPACRPPRPARDKFPEQTNEGISSSRARHFQRRLTAEVWAGSQGVEIVAAEWALLPGTVEFPKGGKQ